MNFGPDKTHLHIPIGVLAALVAMGCNPTFDSSGKDLCSTDTDCLSGYHCELNRCVVDSDLTATDAEVDSLVDVDATVPDGADSDGRETHVDEVQGELDGRDVDLGQDTDNDGVPDAIDNCAALPNPLQEDYDSNQVGDLCQTAQHSSLVITEVMADPESGVGPANGNTIREWQRQYVEVYNGGTTDVDLSGFTLSNLAGFSVTVPTHAGSLLPAKSFFLISGSPVLDADNVVLRGYSHGDSVFRVAQGLNADNTTTFEELTLSHPLKDVGGTGELVADTVSFVRRMPKGTAWQLLWPAASGVLPALANDEGSQWCRSWLAAGHGRDGGTPGGVNGPCFEPAKMRCAGETQVLDLDSIVYGDLRDVDAVALNANDCPATISTLAFANDLNFKVEVPIDTPVSLVFEPIPAVVGDQNGSNMSLEPWYSMVYWRKGTCPAGLPVPPSICLAPSDAPLTSSLLLEANTTYFFTVDGQKRSTMAAFEEGQFTLSLLRL